MYELPGLAVLNLSDLGAAIRRPVFGPRGLLQILRVISI